MNEALEEIKIAWFKDGESSGIDCVNNGCYYHNWSKHLKDLRKLIHFEIITKKHAISLLEKQSAQDHSIMRYPLKKPWKKIEIYGTRHIQSKWTYCKWFDHLHKHNEEIIKFAALRNLFYYIKNQYMMYDVIFRCAAWLKLTLKEYGQKTEFEVKSKYIL